MAYTTIDNPELYFQTKLYTGNGSTQSITFDGTENIGILYFHLHLWNCKNGKDTFSIMFCSFLITFYISLIFL